MRHCRADAAAAPLVDLEALAGQPQSTTADKRRLADPGRGSLSLLHDQAPIYVRRRNDSCVQGRETRMRGSALARQP